jgi:triosephosphate isomerase
MSKKILVANWKMHGNKKLVQSFFKEFPQNLTKAQSAKLDLVFAVPFPLLELLSNVKQDSYKLAAQNCHYQDSGAYTGEVSLELLQEYNTEYVILGHSERRSYCHETDQLVAKKMQNALKHNIIPVICVGETNEQRESGEYKKIIIEQVANSIIKPSNNKQIIVAYEPIWAIGTGKVASNDEVAEILDLIKFELMVKSSLTNVKILYGGSVNASNSTKLSEINSLDGYLVGSASLKAKDFAVIGKSLL